MRRFLQAGAVWAQSFGDLADVRSRMIVSGNPTVVSSPLGKAMRFDGAADYATLIGMDEERLRFNAGTQDFSVACWMRPSAVTDYYLVSKQDGAGDGWALYATPEGMAGFVLDPHFSFTDAGAVVAGAWHCVAAVVDRSDAMRVYVNGVTSGTAADPAGEVMATTVAPRVGAAAWDASTKFSGDIHSVAIWDRVLTPAEVADLAGLEGF